MSTPLQWKIHLELSGPTRSRLEMRGYISEAAKDAIMQILNNDFENEPMPTTKKRSDAEAFGMDLWSGCKP